MSISADNDLAKRYLDIAPAIILSLDHEGMITLLNQSGGEILECDPLDVEGRNWVDTFIPERLREEIRSVFTRLMNGDVEFTQHYENIVLTGRGRERIIRWYNTLLRDSEGSITGILSSGEDITELKNAEDAKRATLERYRRLYESVKAGVMLQRADGVIVHTNDYAAEVFRMPMEDVTGRTSSDPVWQMVLEDGTPVPGDEHPSMITFRTGKPLRDELRGVFAGDPSSTRWLLINTEPVVDPSGSVAEVLVTFIDITDRKQVEAELRSNEYLLSKSQQLGKIGSWELLIDSGRLVWTDETYRLFGVPPGTPMTLEDFMKCVHPDDREYVLKEWDARMKHNDYDIDHRIVVDGEVRWVREKAEIIFDADGKPVKAVGFSQDITERKNAENALRERQEELDEIFNMSLYLICTADLNEATFLKVNASFSRVLGYDESEIVDHSFFEFIHPDDIKPTERVIEEQLRQGSKVMGFTNRYRRKNGSWCYLEWAAHPLPERGITFSIAHDITEERELADRLRQSEKMEAIGQLAGGVAHDFNNHLAGIMNFAELLLDSTQDTELRSIGEGIVRLCTRSGELTGQLLAYARRGQLEITPVDIHEVIEEVISMLRHSIDKRVRISRHLRAEPSTTTGDHSRLESVLLNLALNARDAMPEGGELVFSTGLAHLTEEFCRSSGFDIEPGEYLRVTVADSGTGMDESTRARVFDPFFTTKPQGKGTGMGLASAFGTVVSHNGSIEVSTEPGRGTKVTVHLPLCRAERSGKAPQAKSDRLPDTCRILLVDDEKAVRETTAVLLRCQGYEVDTCSNGHEAVEFFRKSFQSMDLVILDMNMPVMNGRDAFLLMREIDPDVKVILATGFSLDASAREILDEGARSHIQKPFRIRELVELIEQVLGS